MKITLYKQEFELIPLVFVTICIIILISLGNWQLRRLEQKEHFIKTIESNIARPAKPIESLDNNPNHYSKISLSGHFLSNKNIYLYGRRTSSPEKDGYYLLSAFAATNGETYLVSRGWLPHSMKNKFDTNIKFDEQAIYNQQQIIEAITLPDEKKNFFVPDNDNKNNIWFTLDLKLAADNIGITNTNFYIMQINNQLLPEGIKPLTTTHLNKVRNDHLEYAITWYSLAACLFIMFIYYTFLYKRN